MNFAFFLGGHDLEMVEIKSLLLEAGVGSSTYDKHLPWGARAGSYADEVVAALRAGLTPVLVELEDDLAPSINRALLRFVDHHGLRAGAGQQGSLRQIYELLCQASPKQRPTWTRWRELVDANDIGHIISMASRNASAEEIREVRDADRRAQGIDDAVEAESRRAVAVARRDGSLTVVTTRAKTASAVTDFIDVTYGGKGASELLVLMPNEAAFFGSGAVVARLADARPDCWYGGDLPYRGFWGGLVTDDERDALVVDIARDLARRGQRSS